MISIETRSTAGILALTTLRGIGPATAERLASRFNFLDAITDAEPEELRSLVSASIAQSLHERNTMASAGVQPRPILCGLSPLHLPWYFASAGEKARRVLGEAERLGVRVISVFDEEYPEALRLIPDRPPLIFIKGELPSRRSVACIGTREPSEFGEVVSKKIVETLVRAEWSIVSGLAVGVDTLSHKAALHYNGRTIAVMAGGLDSIYPRQNAKLAAEILERGGSLVSEQSFGTPPSPRNLVQRDRLQSGLSVGTFVMQTDVKGGSMHTVRYTIQQNRLLFAPVPQGKHAAEAKSQGILALTQVPASEFARITQAEGEYRKALLERHGEKSVAIPLAGREDYDAMLKILEGRLEAGSNTLTNESLSSKQLSML